MFAACGWLNAESSPWPTSIPGSKFWSMSAVSLPTRPALERMWFGSQYATVGSTATKAVVSKLDGRLPPPGLYGPFATGDFCFWNGDFTLDCESPSTKHVADPTVRLVGFGPRCNVIDSKTGVFVASHLFPGICPKQKAT